jgi:drug/metabolite transporter (DMT)-like permease
MKAFIRTLKLDDRKTLTYSISFTIFEFLICQIIKILTETKLQVYTIVCETGSVISIISLIKIIITLKNNKRKKDQILNLSEYSLIFLKSFMNSVGFCFLVSAVAFSSISTILVIKRQSSFFTFFLAQYIYRDELEDFQLIGCLLDILALGFIKLPAIIGFEESDTVLGIICGFVYMWIFSVKKIFQKKMKKINLDLYMFFTGVFLSIFGGFGLIFSSSEIESISFFKWALIILLSIFLYYSNIFNAKTKTKNWFNLHCLFIFKIASIFLSLIIGILFSEHIIHFHHIIGYSVLLFNTYFYTTKVIAKAKEIRDTSMFEDN